MASNVTKRGPVKPALNITPLIDVVFLLIVFFLLVNNIVTDENPNMKLPEVDKPETIQVVSENRLIISVLPEEEWEGEPGPGSPVDQVLQRGGKAKAISLGGATYPMDDPEQIQAFRDALVAAIQRRHPRGDLRFLFRVDATIYYREVLPVMAIMLEAMFECGLEKGETLIDIVAYMPD
ncbi:MAG: ExbD/TolR family protein [Phycisphaerales bacterium JB063]